MVRKDASASRGKYAKVGNEKVSRPKTGGGIRSCLNRCMGCCVSVVVILVILAIIGISAGGSSEYSNDNLRSGQASEHGTKATKPIKQPQNQVPGALDNYEDDEYKITEEDINEAVEEVGIDLQLAAEDELQKNTDSILTSAVRVFGGYVRIGISKMYSELTAAEVEEIAEEIEEEVQQAVDKEFGEIKDEIVEEEIYKIENMVDAEEGMGEDNLNIESDVYNSENDRVEDLVNLIDDAALEVTDAMQAKAAEIEKKILEKRLSKKLGKNVKLVIIDDEVTTQTIPPPPDIYNQPQQGFVAPPPLPLNPPP